MIKRFIRRVLGLADEQMARVARGEHGLARAALSPAAAKVCTVLREAGFQAYVVGGAVRDLLLAIVPKDFDIATEPEMRDGRFTGRIAGVPCFREGKRVRLEQWLTGLGHRLADFEESAFYSDSHNDLPLLERVTRPVAVDADAALAAEARRRGWAVMSLRR